jgi:hypothetical protein
VPFFVGGHNAFVEGIGEKLTPPSALPRRRWRWSNPRPACHRGHLLAARCLRRDTPAAIVSGFLAGRCKVRVWSRGQQAGGETTCRSRPKPMPRRGPGRPVVRSPLRQQPDDGLGQCGVRESRHGRVATLGDMAGGCNFRRAGWVGCAAVWTSIPCWAGPTDSEFQGRGRKPGPV